ncbi:MAG: thiamine-phosphate kinase [Leptolyngbya foveolarum]|uniref:Thiamine-monophosphate kinase n=1 Tax=Leptolyngbya foveolarum TaxID=47253 RepID=A0A2W4W5T2_9CYAN|nr:MAG: thiamine-phosphate kinase [Leptolyngbya foveolarum]
MSDAVETIAEIGELALLERLRPFCADVVGDDGALLKVAPDHQLVVTTDMLTDGVHFSDRTTPPHSVGWRATAANLSDLAAMGAAPLGITIGLGLPPQTPWPWVQHLYQGIADCLTQYGGAIIGGDLCRANQRTISITALGQVQPQQAIFRHTAFPGMTVVMTGRHGLSRAGLAVLLESADSGSSPDGSKQTKWIEAHQYPVPRFDAIAQIQSIHPHPTISGMDSSDGLANALLQISQRSGVGIEIAQSYLSIPTELVAFVGAKKALKWTLYGGEDFELVLCLSPKIANCFLAVCKSAIAIGITTDSGTVQLRSPDGCTQVIKHQSFQHFS